MLVNMIKNSLKDILHYGNKLNLYTVFLDPKNKCKYSHRYISAKIININLL